MASDRTRDDLENPLGLAHEPVKQTPEDQLPDDPNPGRRRRRARALGEDGIERHTSGLGDTGTDSHGATAIDMGAGGQGNAVEPGDR